MRQAVIWSTMTLCVFFCLASCGGGGGGSSAPPVSINLTVTPSGNLADARVDWPYWTRFQASGGTAPYTYNLASGSLPGGLALDPGGELQGIPTSAGTSTFSLTVSDSSTTPVTANVSTQLVVKIAWDTSKPTKIRNTFFLHHSVGYNLYYRLKLNGLAVQLMLNNFTTLNLAANLPLDMTFGQGKVGNYVIGDNTEADSFPTNFNTPAYFQKMNTWNLPTGQTHQVMMFKSCYNNSDILSEQQLADYKKWYNSMLDTFKQYPNILFIPFSTPPLNPATTTTAAGLRARRFAKWLKYEYSAQLPNLVSFDLFDILAHATDHPTEPNMLNSAYRTGTDSHPTEAGDKAIINRFIPFINAAVRAAGME